MADSEQQPEPPERDSCRRRMVQRDVPVIPISYGTGWALARDGLVGAGQNGLGSMRLAGLAWQK